MATISLQRSKEWLEKRGWHVGICETWNQWSRTRRDLYGLMDLVAVRHDFQGVWGVNAVDDSGVQEHIKKYLNGFSIDRGARKGQWFGPNTHLPVWLAAGNRFSIFAWGKRSADGRGSRKVWTLRVIEFYLVNNEIQTKERTVDELPD